MVTLREIREKSQKHTKINPYNLILYKLSIYFTYIFINLNMTANQVSLLSPIVSIFCGILLNLDLIHFIVMGFFLMFFIPILDRSDGQVARYRNQAGISGAYVDDICHTTSGYVLLISSIFAIFHQSEEVTVLKIGLIAVVSRSLSRIFFNKYKLLRRSIARVNKVVYTSKNEEKKQNNIIYAITYFIREYSYIRLFQFVPFLASIIILDKILEIYFAFKPNFSFSFIALLLFIFSNFYDSINIAITAKKQLLTLQ